MATDVPRGADNDRPAASGGPGAAADPAPAGESAAADLAPAGEPADERASVGEPGPDGARAPVGEPAPTAAEPVPRSGPRPLDADTRRRLDAVFGDVLPTVTSDELDLDEPRRETRPGAEAEARLLADRPPHHDRG